MKKQLLTILGMFFLVLMVGNVMGQGSPRKKPKAKPKDKVGTPLPGGGCVEGKEISIVQDFDPLLGLPMTPTDVQVITRTQQSSEQQLQTTTTNYPNFIYQYTDHYIGELKTNIDFLPTCRIGFHNYETYQVEVIANFPDGAVTTTIVDIVVNGQFTENLVFESIIFPSTAFITNVTASPNPFVNDFSLAYQLSTDVDLVRLEVRDGQGNLLATLQNGLGTTTGVHNIPINGSNWPQGIYYLNVFATKLGQTDVVNYTLVK